MSNATSIRAKLLNIAKKEKIAFQVILLRYIHERFLYRLSISKYKNNFFLKGGNFMYAIEGLLARPTKDIDLLGQDISNDMDNLKNTIVAIINIKCIEDFVNFEAKTTTIEPITEKNLYNGVRLKLNASFDTTKQNIQIDIGFGDSIIPAPTALDYPTLLPDVPAPKLTAYTIETVIAEKFHAMIALSTLNSRMKDFYDVYNLLTKHKIDFSILEKAIKNTFLMRKTIPINDHALFTDDFKNDPKRIQMWKTFLNKINHKGDLPFQTIMQTITKQLKPLIK